jgi:hypothetical protein
MTVTDSTSTLRIRDEAAPEFYIQIMQIIAQETQGSSNETIFCCD